MGAGSDHRVILQHLRAFVVKLLIGDDVVVVALRLHPRGEVGVGGEVAQPRASNSGVRVGDVTDAHVQHGPMPRRDGDSAPVGMMVVGREPVLDVAAGVVRISAPLRGLRLPVRLPPRVPRPLGTGMVRVDRVREGRDEHRDRCGGPALRRHHEERDVLPRVRRREHQRAGGRASALGHRPLERHRPAAVVDVVLVEVDRRVLARGMSPAHLAGRSTPSRSSLGPGR